VMTTTNGTVALRACVGAARVLVGAVLNLRAVAAILRQWNAETVLLVCATGETLALEERVGGGTLAEFRDAEWSDAARVAYGTAQTWPQPLESLKAARNGKVLLKGTFYGGGVVCAGIGF